MHTATPYTKEVAAGKMHVYDGTYKQHQVSTFPNTSKVPAALSQMHAFCNQFHEVSGNVKHADRSLLPGIDVQALYADVILPDSGTGSS